MLLCSYCQEPRGGPFIFNHVETISGGIHRFMIICLEIKNGFGVVICQIWKYNLGCVQIKNVLHVFVWRML